MSLELAVGSAARRSARQALQQPVSEQPELPLTEKLEMAFKLLQQGEKGRALAKALRLPRSTLYRFLGKVKKNPKVDPMELLRARKPGAPPVVSAEGKDRLRQTISKGAMQQHAPTTHQAREMLLEIMREEAVARTGRDVIKVPHPDTVRRILNDVAPVIVRAPAVQNVRRWMVGLDLRNALSMAAMAHLVFDPADPRTSCNTITNTDITSVFLEQETGSVRLSAESMELLATQHKSPSITAKELQRRCIQMMVTTSAAGETVCVIVILKDRNIKAFSSTKLKMEGACLIPTFLFLVPNGEAKCKETMVVAVRDIIAPAVIKIRQRLVEQAVEEHGHQSDAAAKARNVRLVLSFDGEDQQLSAFIQELCVDPREGLAKQGFTLLKYAASASKTQQPCDVAHSFMALKSLAKSLMLAGASSRTPCAALDEQLAALLSGLDSGSRATFSLFLSHLPDILPRAFLPSTIRSGWEVAGYRPLDPDRILARCTTWAELDAAQAEAIKRAIPKLVEHARIHGTIPDGVMQQALAGAVDFEVWLQQHSGVPPKKSGLPLHRMVLSRQRAAIMGQGAADEVVEAFIRRKGSKVRRPAPAGSGEGAEKEEEEEEEGGDGADEEEDEEEEEEEGSAESDGGHVKAGEPASAVSACRGAAAAAPAPRASAVRRGTVAPSTSSAPAPAALLAAAPTTQSAQPFLVTAAAAAAAAANPLALLSHHRLERRALAETAEQAAKRRRLEQREAALAACVRDFR